MVHVDLVGPLPEAENNRYLFTMVDRFTRWVEVVPLATITAESCCTAFVRSWVSRFGIPSTLISDRRAQFTSNMWKELHRLLGVKARSTTAYHPQANGMVERFHRQLKASLMAVAENGNWMSSLPLVLLGLF